MSGQRDSSPAISRAATAIAFGLVGPVIGHIGFVLLGGLFDTFVEFVAPNMTLRTPPEFWRMLRLASNGLFSPSVLVMAYVFGAVPALITGMLAAVLVRRLRTRAYFLLTCTIIGAVISGVVSKVMRADIAFVAISASAGASAALVLCGLLWELAQPRTLPVIEQELS
nr:hypothetical protein [Methylobacterium sp. ZNC0032]